MTLTEVIVMIMIYALLLIGAVVCFVLATLGVRVGSPRREVNMVALGLLLWVLVPLIQTVQRAV